MKSISLICLGLLLLTSSACTSSSPGSSYEGWVPYIDSTDAPATLEVGEVGRVTLTLSANQRPALLTTGNDYFPHVILVGVDGSGNWQYDVAISPRDSWVANGNDTQGAGNTVQFEISYPEAGSYELRIRSAATRELGGSEVTVVTTPGHFISLAKGNVSEQIVPINVVPASP